MTASAVCSPIRAFNGVWCANSLCEIVFDRKSRRNGVTGRRECCGHAVAHP